MSKDRIEKSVTLRAPRSHVWRALSDADEFGEWFGVKLNGSFKPGTRIQGKITLKGYENLPLEMSVDRIEPERLLSWRWHPYAIDLKKDYSSEPTTLVVFELEEVSGGTRLKVVESGFDALPESRREEAYQANDKGWAMQMESIEQHLAKAA
jgi:uncharacterized protein YndB with AHSA1/START domain